MGKKKHSSACAFQMNEVSDIMDKNQIGIGYMQEGKWEEAAKAFMEAIEESPNDAVSYINFGNVLTAVGDTKRALDFFKRPLLWMKTQQLLIIVQAIYFMKMSNFSKQKICLNPH